MGIIADDWSWMRSCNHLKDFWMFLALLQPTTCMQHGTIGISQPSLDGMSGSTRFFVSNIFCRCLESGKTRLKNTWAVTKTPGYLMYVGDEILPSCNIGIIISHYFWIPITIYCKQPVFHGKYTSLFFSWLMLIPGRFQWMIGIPVDSTLEVLGHHFFIGWLRFTLFFK